MIEDDKIKSEWAKRMPRNLVLVGCFISKKKFKIQFRGNPDLFDENGEPLTTEIVSDRRKNPLCIQDYGMIEHIANCYAQMRTRKGQHLPN